MKNNGLCEFIPQKIRVIDCIAKYRYTEQSFIQNMLNIKAKVSSFRVFLYKIGLDSFLWGKIRIWYISKIEHYQELRKYYQNMPLYKISKVNFNDVEHCLGLNQVIYALHQHPRLNIDSLWTENYIRALHVSERFEFSYNKIPDSIITHKNFDGSKKKLFIEFERSLKARSRYLDILRHYAKRSDVTKGSVVYVCSNQLIRKELRKLTKELFGNGVINNLEEIFQFIDFNELTTTKDGGLIC